MAIAAITIMPYKTVSAVSPISAGRYVNVLLCTSLPNRWLYAENVSYQRSSMDQYDSIV